MIGTTGPNVSSRAISIDSVTRSRIVGWKNSALPELGRATATGVERRAALDRLGDLVLGLGRGPLVVERTHRRGAVERIAEPHLPPDRLDEPLQVRVVDRPVDEDALARGAALAGVQEAGRDRRADRRLQVRVVEDHERAVAAHLEQQLLAGRARRAIFAAGRRGSDEPDRGDAWVARDLVADLVARPGHEVEDARRQAAFDDARGERDGAAAT